MKKIFFLFVLLLGPSIQAQDHSFQSLFHSQYNTHSPKGITQVFMFHTKVLSEPEAKRHCSSMHKGFTACYYFTEKPSIKNLSSKEAPFKIMDKAWDLSWNAFITVSVDGKTIDFQKK